MRTPLCLIVLALAASAHADPLIYEGELGGADPFAAVDLRFTLHDAAADGEAIWTSDPIAVALDDDGRFVAEIEAGPAGTLQPRHFAGPRWLQVTVLPAAGGEVPLEPRQRIGRVPLSFDGKTLSGPEGVYVMRVDCPDVEDPADVPLAGHYASIHDALAWLADKRIAADTTVEIRVVSRTCYNQPPIEITHPGGAQIQILGGQAGTELRFRGDGLVLSNGHRLARMSGFLFVGSDGDSDGVRVESGASVELDALHVQRFDKGFVAIGGGSILDSTPFVDSPLVASDCVDGFVSAYDGRIEAPHARAEDGAGDGFRTSQRGLLIAAHSHAARNGGHGFVAYHQSSMNITHANADTNAGVGFMVQQNSHLYADYSYAHSNGSMGYRASSGGTIDASVTTSTGNSTGYYAITSGAIIATASYVFDNLNSAVWAQYEGYIYFRCDQRDAAQEDHNPDPEPPEAVFTGGGRDADVYATHEGRIDLIGCPRAADGVEFDAYRLIDGFVNHPDGTPLRSQVLRGEVDGLASTVDDLVGDLQSCCGGR